MFPLSSPCRNTRTGMSLGRAARFLYASLLAFGMFLGLAPANASAAVQEIIIVCPHPDDLRVLDDADALLKKLAEAGDQEAGPLGQHIAPMQARLRALQSAAESLNSRPLTPNDRAEVDAHNARCDAAKEDLRSLVEQVQNRLTGSGMQIPALLRSMAADMAASGEYRPRKGQTFCNRFLDDYAKFAFGYQGFDGKHANDVVDQLRKENGGNWTPLLDRDPAVKGGTNFTPEQAMKLAQECANNGLLVVVGWKNNATPKDGEDPPSGHVAVVVPGQLEKSGKWGGMELPQIAQAGHSVFAGKHLAYGFGPGLKDEVVLYVYSPGRGK